MPPLPQQPTFLFFALAAKRAGSVHELQVLWRNAKAIGLLTHTLENVMRRRAAELKKHNEIGESQS